MHKVLQGSEAIKKHIKELPLSKQDDAKNALKDISVAFLNAIHITNTYRNHIESVLGSSGSPSERSARLLRDVERELNQRILEAKHKDTKEKRLKEKGLVLNFYKKHSADITSLLRLDAILSKTSLKEEVQEEPGLVVPPESLSVSRNLMPQIPGDQHKNYLSYLDQNMVKHGMFKVAPKHLKATQSEFNLDKVKSIMDTDKDYKPALISNDFYILDGHHRWLADYNKDKDEPVPVRMIDKPILDLMSLTHRFNGVSYKSVTEEKLHK